MKAGLSCNDQTKLPDLKTSLSYKDLLKNILRTFGTSQGGASLDCYSDIIYSEYVGGEQIRKLQGIVCLENSGHLAKISQSKSVF